MICPNCNRHPLRYDNDNPQAHCIGCLAVFTVTLTLIPRTAVDINNLDLQRINEAHKFAAEKKVRDKAPIFSL